MSTVAEHVQSVRRILFGAHRPMLNRLETGIDNAVESLTTEFEAKGIGRGSYLAMGDEILYVWSRTDNVVSVMRGALGTTPAAHSAGALIEIDPRFPNPLIKDEMKAEIGSWPRSIYRRATAELSFAAGDTAAAFAPSGLIDVLRVYREPIASTDDRWPDVGFTHKRDLGKIFLDTTGSSSKSFDVTVVYSKTFDTATFADATDLQADVGLSANLEDALKYGTCWRLLAGREVKRTFTEGQGEPRNAEEVPPGHAAAVARQFLELRDRRLSDEARRLAGEVGWRAQR